MRLVQLARLLQISPSLLEDFLKNRNAVFSGAHSRLTNQDIAAAVTHFAPEKMHEVLAFGDVAEEQSDEETSIDQTHVHDSASEVTSAQQRSDDSDDSDDKSTVEVIRAPKVELPGLRVVGKIELPEPIKRESTEVGRNENPRVVKPGRQPFDRKDGRQPRRNDNSRNPLQEKREREQREAEERRKEEARQAKERRTLAYIKQQSQRDKKSAAPKPRQKAESGNKPVVTGHRSTSWFGRFWRWLAHGE